MRDWKRVVPLPLLIILFGILTFWVYQGEQQRTIADHQSRQLLLAQQASRSIQSFFEHSLHDLTYLAGVPQIIDFSDAGKQIMLDWFAANRTGVQAITRVDSLGHILSTVPFNPSSIGADIHNQLHVQRILATHQPVISDVFRAVQGYDAVAVHVPVFADLEFRGSLALLIPFEHLVASCLENIRSSAGSEMLVISRAGVELYSQLPAPDPAAASTVSLPAPYLATLEAMRQGKEGAAEFILPDTSLPGSKASKRYAAFSPVELGDTHWSICISDREEVVLSATATFRQQLLLLFGLILLIVLVYFYYFLHARMILRTEKERIQNEERLRESEEKYRSILREIAEGYIELDLQGRIEFVGQPMEKISGYSGEQLLGRPFTQFINAASAGVYEDTRQAMLQTAASTRHLQMDLVHQDGGERQVEVSFTQKADRAGNPTGLRAVIRDVTARIQAERELRELEINLQQARKMEALGTLAGGVAHDLNNILSGIVSYPDYLLTQIEPNSKLRKPLEVIRDSGHKAAATVQDLLTLARRGVVSKDVVNLNDIIGNYLNSLPYKQLLEDFPRVEVVTELNPELLNTIGSAVQLSTSLMNIVTNAVEAMPGGGKVRISTANKYIDLETRHLDSISEGEFAVLTIGDEGIGISQEDQERIFEPFYTKKKMGRSGTGLGMAVVWGAVKDHGGFIDLQSEPGRGTTFRLYFPASREPRSEQPPLLAPASYQGQGELILVVDDVEQQRRITTGMLSELGYQVEAVASGEEAVEFLRERKVDLLLLDMIMEPGIDGLETYRRSLEVQPEQRSIIVSGFSANDRVKAAQELGAGEYIRKPFTMERIAQAVKQALEK